MLAADVVALGTALAATKIATRADKPGRRTFGSYRAEVFASGLMVLLMLGVSVYVVIKAISQIGSTLAVATTPMITVGGLGLLVNILAMLLLRGGAEESLNAKGAYFAVVADTAGSVGVLVAGVLIATTGKSWRDTIVALCIGLFVAVRAAVLGRQVLAFLGLHVWVLTSGVNVATAHLVGEDTDTFSRILDDARTMLKGSTDPSEHATLQVERGATPECHEIDW